MKGVFFCLKICTFAVKMDKILITGASGFIGSFIVEEALKRNMEVWAAVRRSSSREWLQDERIHFIELNLSSEDELKKQLQDHVFDYVVHAAGVTKCLRKEQFYAVNTEGTKHLVNVLLALQMPLKQFIRETDTPQPNTEYGKSKLEAETFLKEVADRLPYVILRPTGVYGPREKDYFLMVKSIQSHSDFSVGFKRQDITFVYVKDVVQAIFLAMERGKSGRCYFLSDGQVYQSATFSDLLIRELGNPWCLRIKAPIWLLRIVTFFGEQVGRITGKISALNNDKYHILKQRNWRCDIQPAIDELGYQPEYQLERGVKETVAWYKEHHWI